MSIINSYDEDYDNTPDSHDIILLSRKNLKQNNTLSIKLKYKNGSINQVDLSLKDLKRIEFNFSKRKLTQTKKHINQLKTNRLMRLPKNKK
ncbi:MAG: hypothetical protein U9N59_07040 [Campylobacterota bacterium]|nr:hypothetical protein [Campylobacterota bacterium]